MHLLILSTRSYTRDDIPLCTLGIPFRMIDCDYELSFFLMDLYGKIQPEMMKFWLPAFEPQVFRPLFVKTNRLDIYNEEDSSEILMEKIASLIEQPIEIAQNQFELLGYPIQSEFYYIDDYEQLQQLRKKWNIKSEEIPVLVSMGKNGVGVLQEIFDELLEFSSNQKRLPIKYIFVCGKNVNLEMKLNKKIIKNKNRFKICGLLSPQEMNGLMNLCPLSISKPGGAVSSEALETGSYLLMMASHPWEEANGSKIERLGLGKKLNKSKAIGLQVEDCIRNGVHLKRRIYQNILWRDQLMHHIKWLRNRNNGDSI